MDEFVYVWPNGHFCYRAGLRETARDLGYDYVCLTSQEFF